MYKILLSVFSFILWTQPVLEGQESGFTPGKYNVLFIMVDDLRPELGCYGKSHVISPNLDRLAGMGQLFENAYSSMPSCGPSRASLLSGLYPSQNRFRAWNCAQDVDVPGVASLPMYLRNHGYKTISLGKVYNNFDDGRGSWDMVWKPPITTTEMWDYQSPEGIRIFFEQNADRLYDTRQRSYNRVPKKSISHERPDVDDMTYVDGRCASKAMEMLEELKHETQPFFMAVGFNKPHLPYTAPNRYWKMYDDLNLDSIRQQYQQAAPQVEEVAFHNNYEFRSHQDIPSESTIPDSTWNRLLQGYLACISYIDFQIGRVLNTLEYMDMAENTLIVLWSDHGYHLGENQMWGKATNYKMSARVPFILKLPNQMKSIRQQGMVESVDIYPTLCELLGIPIPYHTQGESFADQISNPELSGKEAVFVRMIRARNYHETVLTEDYSLTQFYDQDDRLVKTVLYDLKSDPGENYNVIGEAGLEPISKALIARLHRHMEARNRIVLDP